MKKKTWKIIVRHLVLALLPERYEVDDGHYVYCHLYDKERREQQK